MLFLSGGDEDEDAPLTTAAKPVIDGEEGIEQKKKKKKEIQYPLLADVSDAAQITQYAGIKIILWFGVFILSFTVQSMPGAIIACNQQKVAIIGTVCVKPLVLFDCYDRSALACLAACPAPNLCQIAKAATNKDSYVSPWMELPATWSDGLPLCNSGLS